MSKRCWEECPLVKLLDTVGNEAGSQATLNNMGLINDYILSDGGDAVNNCSGPLIDEPTSPKKLYCRILPPLEEIK